MQRRHLVLQTASAVLALVTPWAAAQTPELRLVTHASFELPKELLADFEAKAGVKLSIVKAGDAGEMLNKLILTRAQPIGDVVFGLDNSLAAKAMASGVIEAYTGAAAKRPAAANLQSLLQSGLVPVDYGYVTLNYDRAWFAKNKLPLPTTLEQLTQPRYKNLLVVQNPATSSPGFAFLAATVAGLGEKPAFDWWARMRNNGMAVAKGWSEAYYTEFSQNGGKYPLVVSYASSPAAEVFYSKVKLTEPPTGALFLKGGVFRQVEGVALIKGGGQREAAAKFIEFLRSGPVQQALQTNFWMLPAEPGTPRDAALRHATEPTRFDNPTPQAMAANASDWVSRWTRVVLK